MRRRGLSDRVTFHGRVDEATKQHLLRAAAVNILPSRKEGWGITVLEAGSFGTPTIASSVPGLWESVRHGETGVLVTQWDVAAWAGAIRRIVEDPMATRRMGCNARRFARAFEWDEIADLWERYLLDLLGQDGASGRS